MKQSEIMSSGFAGVLALLVVMTSTPALAQGIQVDLLPAAPMVNLGDTFDLELTVAAPSDSFNAFEATLTFDDSLLTFIPLTTAQREGALMTSACANRFRLFSQSEGQINLTLGLLCAGVKVAGPGVIFRFRFQVAVPGPVQSAVAITSIQFANAGSYVNPVTSSDALVTIGDLTAVPDGEPRGFAAPSAAPNPFRRATQIAFTPQHDGPLRIEIFAVNGRRVRTLFAGEATAGVELRSTWDARSDAGAVSPAGVYFVTVAGREGNATSRLVRLP